MADKKILDNELLDDDQLDNVAGGTYTETFKDIDHFKNYCGIHFSGDKSEKREQLRDLLWANGVKLKDHGGNEANEYYLLNPNGTVASRVDRDTALGFAGANIKQKQALGLPVY